MIVDASACESSLVLGDASESEEEGEKKGVGDDVLRAANSRVGLEEVVCLSCEDDDGGREGPKEAEDQLLL